MGVMLTPRMEPALIFEALAEERKPFDIYTVEEGRKPNRNDVKKAHALTLRVCRAIEGVNTVGT